MALMKKANCEKQVPNDKIKDFLDLGYSLIDEKGNIVERGNPRNRDDLRIANANLKKDLDAALEENETLVEENAALKAKVEELTAAITDAEDVAKKAAEGSVKAALEENETAAESTDTPAAPSKRGRKAAAK